jgi:hypothetical protein
MPNYQQAKAYVIRSVSRPDLIYIGSTTQRLSKRFNSHKLPSNTTSSRQIILLGDAYIELLEEFPCDNKEQLLKREGELIRSHTCVNNRIAGRTPVEYRSDNAEAIRIQKQQYRIDNIDKIKQARVDNADSIKLQRKVHYDDNADRLKLKGRQYYQDNKDARNLKNKQYQTDSKDKIKLQKKQHYADTKKIRVCVCGGRYDSNRKSHYNSQTHIAWVDNFYERLRAI